MKTKAKRTSVKRSAEGEVEEPPPAKIKQEVDMLGGSHSPHCQIGDYQYLVRFEISGFDEDDIDDLAASIEEKLEALQIEACTSATSPDSSLEVPLSRDVSFKTQEDLDAFTQQFDGDFTATGMSLRVMKTHHTSSQRSQQRFFSYHFGKRIDELRLVEALEASEGACGHRLDARLLLRRQHAMVSEYVLVVSVDIFACHV